MLVVQVSGKVLMERGSALMLNKKVKPVDVRLRVGRGKSDDYVKNFHNFC